MPDSIDIIAGEIITAINALGEHWLLKHGGNAETAFNPDDEATPPLFTALWKASFNRNLSPDEQRATLAAIKEQAPGAIEEMQYYSHLSEQEMEKGFAVLAIERCKNLNWEEIFSAPEHSFWQGKCITTLSDLTYEGARVIPGNVTRDRKCVQTIADAKKYVQKQQQSAVADGSSRAIELAAKAQNEYTQLKISALTYIFQDFPYPTYEGMQHSEFSMLCSFNEFDTGNAMNSTSLIVEAGAIPFSAMYSSITRGDANVIATYSKQDLYKSAETLIDELTEVGVLEEGTIQPLRLDPHSTAFETYDFTQHGVKPYAALITQRVYGANNIYSIMQTLVNKHGIDPVVTRDAHGFVELLYEPLSPKGASNNTSQRHVCSTIPPHSGVQPDDEGQVIFWPYMFCYNTSRVWSQDIYRLNENDVTISGMFHGTTIAR